MRSFQTEPGQALRVLVSNRALKPFFEAAASGSVKVGGVTAGAAAALSAALFHRFGRDVLLVVPHIDIAEDLHENLGVFTNDPALLEPRDRGTSFQDEPFTEAARSRLRLFQRYLEGAQRPPVVVTSAPALLETAPDPVELAGSVLRVARGDRLERDALVEWLVDHSFKREYAAEAPWLFAVRGGIVDVFAPGQDAAARVEFFGDEVASLRFIDPQSGRSTRAADHLTIVAPKPAGKSVARSTFVELIDENAIVVIWEASDVQSAALSHITRVGGAGTAAWADVWESLRRRRLIETTAFQFGSDESISLDTRSFSIAARDVEGIIEEFADFALDMKRTFVFAANEAEGERLEQLFGNRRRKKPFDVLVGRFGRSFYFGDRSLALVGHQDIFHRYRQRRRLKPVIPSAPVSSVLELTAGDHVVHADHGIARYKGNKVIEKDGVRREYMILVFSRNTRLLVPVSHIDLVSKYMGPSQRAPKLSSIGSQIWKTRKARVARAVRELAAELMRLQAVRTTKNGIAYDFGGPLQNQFEAEFIYEETDDQLRTMAEIRGDMQEARPMDRLLCGDVGFGKTELAVRAAFAAVSGGKQVAVLVPTTVLAEQHYRTFSERMADYPVLIEVLSRLRPKREQRETLARLKGRQVDIVIGTHRLVQRDVVFADLGLVIIDEEQRFGVAAKERLKRLRETVDVLTLTATPIPRTLHMALVGLRDICVLETPPQGRQSVSTFVGRLAPERLREVILRELDREGQVFFVHNRVQTIDDVAARLALLVPEARITVAHGQMDEGLLASRMVDFVEGRYDVLVSTTIIENGLDIPNVNTIVADEADMFGLADLHQLRGRVGRYKRRAYAYFLLPEARPVSPEARKRLQAIEHFSELGSGFRIALRDMELRGVGNVLGREQSGHVALVGYELYCRLLSEAVSDVKGDLAARIPESYIELGTSCFMPESYIESPVHRLDLYKRLSTAYSLEALDTIEEEMRDRFGPLPAEAEEFLLVARLRILAFENGISMILARKDHLALQGGPIETAAEAFAGPGRTVRVIDERDAVVFFEDGMPSGARLLRLLVEMLQGEPVGI
ncbi:MAG: transcription-repair coupling factor [Planctomycetota bacterium]